jgi:hypothetical protein
MKKPLMVLAVLCSMSLSAKVVTTDKEMKKAICQKREGVSVDAFLKLKGKDLFSYAPYNAFFARKALEDHRNDAIFDIDNELNRNPILQAELRKALLSESKTAAEAVKFLESYRVQVNYNEILGVPNHHTFFNVHSVEKVGLNQARVEFDFYDNKRFEQYDHKVIIEAIIELNGHEFSLINPKVVGFRYHPGESSESSGWEDSIILTYKSIHNTESNDSFYLENADEFNSFYQAVEKSAQQYEQEVKAHLKTNLSIECLDILK